MTTCFVVRLLSWDRIQWDRMYEGLGGDTEEWAWLQAGNRWVALCPLCSCLLVPSCAAKSWLLTVLGRCKVGQERTQKHHFTDTTWVSHWGNQDLYWDLTRKGLGMREWTGDQFLWYKEELGHLGLDVCMALILSHSGKGANSALSGKWH